MWPHGVAIDTPRFDNFVAPLLDRPQLHHVRVSREQVTANRRFRSPMADGGRFMAFARQPAASMLEAREYRDWSQRTHDLIGGGIL
jgi:hypothetical protein